MICACIHGMIKEEFGHEKVYESSKSKKKPRVIGG